MGRVFTCPTAVNYSKTAIKAFQGIKIPEKKVQLIEIYVCVCGCYKFQVDQIIF